MANLPEVCRVCEIVSPLDAEFECTLPSCPRVLTPLALLGREAVRDYRERCRAIHNSERSLARHLEKERKKRGAPNQKSSARNTRNRHGETVGTIFRPRPRGARSQA